MKKIQNHTRNECIFRLNLHPEEDEAVADWFYDPKPLLDFNGGQQVNGSSYRKWTLTLPQMSVLYRLANQLLSGKTHSFRV